MVHDFTHISPQIQPDIFKMFLKFGLLSGILKLFQLLTVSLTTFVMIDLSTLKERFGNSYFFIVNKCHEIIKTNDEYLLLTRLMLCLIAHLLIWVHHAFTLTKYGHMKCSTSKLKHSTAATFAT